MTPLPNYKAVPDGWAAHHRPAVTAHMSTPCTILEDAGAPPYPLPEGWTGETVKYTTTCRLQELKREAGVLPGDQPTQVRQYMVQLPYDPAMPALAVGEGGDTVLVNGRRYAILQVMHGSELWSWDLICQDNLTQNQEA